LEYASSPAAASNPSRHHTPLIERGVSNAALDVETAWFCSERASIARLRAWTRPFADMNEG
jgi:hypothetical protein